MTRPRRRQALFLAGLLLFLAFFLFSALALVMVPSELRLVRGEVGRLRVSFPLRLFAPEVTRPYLANTRRPYGNELSFHSQTAAVFQVELRLLSMPLRKVAVRIEEERLVVPGGQAIGVLLSDCGVVVVGHQPLRGLDGERRYPAREAGLEVGDVIMHADGLKVKDAFELARLADLAVARRKQLRLTIRREGRLIIRRIDPVLCRHPESGSGEERPRGMLGLFVEDPAAGVGTLTFYDPASGGFAALGHKVNELGGQNRAWLEGGKIVAARISGIEQGQRGDPGEKIGTFAGSDDVIGTIGRNTRFGIFGVLDAPLRGKGIPIALSHQVKPGPATMLTVVQGREVQEFEVEIVRIYRQTQPRDKGLVIRVSDPELLKLTGGIVQGMSGSPLIQEGRLIGAVTHVFINDPTRGYGVLAEWMLRAMEEDTPASFSLGGAEGMPAPAA